MGEMVCAMSFRRNTRVNDTTVERMHGRPQQIGNIKQLQLLLNNWAGGMDDKTISCAVHTGLDDLRKLYHQQLPEIEHQKQLLMHDFNDPKAANDATELRDRMQYMELIALFTQS